VTKHDPTDEAETLPGIPKAGSDLEQFPSIPGIVGGGGQSIDTAVQEITAVLGIGVTSVSVAISAVVLGRTYIWKQGPGNISGGQLFGEGWNANAHSVWIEQPTTTSVLVSRNSAAANPVIGPSLPVSVTTKISVVEFT
jgi:hypothetical protein